MDRRPWPPKSAIASLTPDQRRTLFAAGLPKEFAAEEVLVHQGETTKHVYVLIDGLTKVTSSSHNGREVLLAIRSRGDLIGELAGMDDRPRVATVAATGPVLALVIGHREFEAYLARDPEAFRAVSASVVGKLRSTTERVVDYSAHEAPVRLAACSTGSTWTTGCATTTVLSWESRSPSPNSPPSSARRKRRCRRRWRACGGAGS